MADTVGMQDIRGENIDKGVKGFAMARYKFKQVCLVQKSKNWKETYFKERAEPLEGPSTFDIQGVPRNTEFPFAQTEWTETSARNKKFGLYTEVSWEDIKTSEINVLAREMIRNAEGVVKRVDTAIYAALIADADIQTDAAVATWDSATTAEQNPIKDMLKGLQAIEEYNYETDKAVILMSPKDYTNLMQNSKVINNPSFKTADVVSNGRVGQIVGMTIIKSVNVPADEALIVVSQVAAVWKTVSPLKTVTIDNPGINLKIRTWEVGVTMVTNPKAIYRITNTQT